MSIEEQAKLGCPNCGSGKINISVSTPITYISDGSRRKGCYDGTREQCIECFDCGHEDRECSYEKSNDGRENLIDELIKSGSHPSLLWFG